MQNKSKSIISALVSVSVFALVVALTAAGDIAATSVVIAVVLCNGDCGR
jgi:hypothetical protein